MEAVVLRCAECGCVSVDGAGWVGKSAFAADEDAAPSTAMYCPPCAAAEFGYRTDEAESYHCVWEAPGHGTSN